MDKSKWDSEVIALSAGDAASLLDKLAALESYLNKSESEYTLAEVARTLVLLNPCLQGSYRLAIVATSIDDLRGKLARASATIRGSGGATAIQEHLSGIYFGNDNTSAGGRMAFVLPGLGSAYAGMLAELCTHFSEVQFVFDFVDQLATVCGDSDVPSRSIFPGDRDNGSLKSASLAAADWAVVAVLLAEYALNELLGKFGIKPDVYMGCSTGEFAALTMSGAIDVLKEAVSFYKLSTRVARSVPTESLAALRSVRVFAPWPDVKPLVAEGVYLGADLSADNIILTGQAHLLDATVSRIREHGHVCHMLPLAIPYHTPLVKNVLSFNDDEIQSIAIKEPSVEAWSCSLAARYPRQSEQVRKITLELFSQPVRLRETVQEMHNQGVRTFIEVGPNGVLTSLIADILAGLEHNAFAANLSSRSSLTQINHLLAALFCQQHQLKLEYAFQQRDSIAVIDALAQLITCPPAATQDEIEMDPVVASFLRTTKEFYDAVTRAQEQVLVAYLSDCDNDSESEGGAVDAPDYGPFISRADIKTQADGTVGAEIKLTLAEDRYLLDHAIGGVVAQHSGDRVHLVPLMVALEIMGETASLLHGQLSLCRFESIKAHRRIVVDSQGTSIKVVAAPAADSGQTKATVELLDDAGDLLMEAQVVFAEQRSSDRKSPFSLPRHDDLNPLTVLDNKTLYGPGVMFHGPRMQAVRQLWQLDKRTLFGLVDGNAAVDWFARPGSMLAHPLLLDNASQLVLFHLFESRQPVNALLPFYIESVELFAGMIDLQGDMYVQANVHVANERGTQADLTGITAAGEVVFCINNINSRRIALSPLWQSFVHDPTLSLSRPLSCHEDYILGQTMTVADLPEDDVTLDWCVDYILTQSEKLTWNTKFSSDSRKKEWLLGRICAKDSVRALLKKESGLALAPHDLEIVSESSGKPVVRILHKSESDYKQAQPCISISHAGGRAIAAAALATNTLGVDIEIVEVRDSGMSDLVLDEWEQRFVAGSADEHLAFTCLWSAKEALCKAFGGSVRDYHLEGADQGLPQTENAVASLKFAAHEVTVTRQAECIVAVVAGSALVGV